MLVLFSLENYIYPASNGVTNMERRDPGIVSALSMPLDIRFPASMKAYIYNNAILARVLYAQKQKNLICKH